MGLLPHPGAVETSTVAAVEMSRRARPVTSEKGRLSGVVVDKTRQEPGAPPVVCPTNRVKSTRRSRQRYCNLAPCYRGAVACVYLLYAGCLHSPQQCPAQALSRVLDGNLSLTIRLVRHCGRGCSLDSLRRGGSRRSTSRPVSLARRGRNTGFTLQMKTPSPFITHVVYLRLTQRK